MSEINGDTAQRQKQLGHACHVFFRSLADYAGFKASRGGVIETPKRMAKAWAFWTSGYSLCPADVLKQFDDGAENYDAMVVQQGIPFYSHCEHHMAPFFGVVHIGYLPDKRIVGLSKLARVVNIFARRLQVQERLTTEIAQALDEGLKPLGVGVVVEARHLCIESRGVEKPGTITRTSALRGQIHNHAGARAEFLSFVNTNRWDGR
jgi:GTP cyclohydrolase IA